MSAEAANAFIREVWGLQGAAYLVVGLRYYSRLSTLGWRKFAWDDFLMGVAVLVYTADDGVHKMRRIIFWAYIIMPVTYVSCLLVAFFKCIPFDHQWQINPNPGNHCLPAISFIQTIFVMAMNTATDFYLMAIPLPMVWKSHLPWRKKVTLLIMFSGGFLEMAFGILRCVSILTAGETDSAQSGYWSVRESFVSVVLTNMPMVYPLFKTVIDKSRNASTNKSGAMGDSQGYRLGSYPGKKGPSSHPLSIPDETKWGSKEHIVANSAEKGASSGGEEASIDSGSGKQPSSPYMPHTDAEVAADSGNNAMRSRKHEQNKIVVTTEYKISRATPEPHMYHMPHRSSRQDFH
ncbi:hypothetical protein K4K57_003456 [Colletotrichum sp. SAR 10_99]|nr:hypothetical protein K4K55_007820 [Colletotrichum sp. SAR 10_96]KAJ5020049.1 hypothetical protein K4K57_003456 [Colletotrichum sp. SAR 10_99]